MCLSQRSTYKGDHRGSYACLSHLIHIKSPYGLLWRGCMELESLQLEQGGKVQMNLAEVVKEVSSINLNYLNTTVQQIGILVTIGMAIVGIFVYIYYLEVQKRLERRVDQKITELESALYGQPRVGALVKIGPTAIFKIVVHNGTWWRIGYTNLPALDSWNSDPSAKLVFANMSERELQELGTVSDRKPGYRDELEQALAEKSAPERV